MPKFSFGLHAKNRLGCMPEQPGTKTVDIFTKSQPGCSYRTSSGAHIQIVLMYACVPNHTSGKQKAASRCDFLKNQPPLFHRFHNKTT